MPVLTGAKDVSGAADLEVAKRDPESRTKLGKLADSV